jgi:nickel transport protein
MKKHYNTLLPGIFLASVIIFLMNTSVLAHKVVVFAWVEGDTVFTESKFSGGKPAKNSQILVYDREGGQLLEGKTDDKGEFSFKIPKFTDLKVVLNASMGHKAEWTIPESEILETGNAPEKKEGGESPDIDTATLSKEEIKQLIDDSLEKKLRPIVRMLTALNEKGPSVTEVIGGIGYIFGLMGIALYFKTREKNKHR